MLLPIHALRCQVLGVQHLKPCLIQSLYTKRWLWQALTGNVYNTSDRAYMDDSSNISSHFYSPNSKITSYRDNKNMDFYFRMRDVEAWSTEACERVENLGPLHIVIIPLKSTHTLCPWRPRFRRANLTCMSKAQGPASDKPTWHFTLGLKEEVRWGNNMTPRIEAWVIEDTNHAHAEGPIFSVV